MRPAILVACSGGPDSVALVWALKEQENEFPVRMMIGHVNHQLRGKESDKDEAFVKALGARVGWPVRVKQAPIRATSGNLEEMARVKRYNALFQMAKENGCSVVATAHTLDDQVETMLMNMLRGTGPSGLGGMPAARRWEGSSFILARPFLRLSKRDVVQFLKKRRLNFRRDASNRSTTYMRNWLRRSIIPVLDQRAPGFKKRMGQLAEMMREEDAFWRAYLMGMEKELLRKKGAGHLLDLTGLLRYPAAAQRRFLRHVLGRDLLTFDGVERLRHWMNSPPTNGRIWQARKGWVVERLSKSQGSPSSKHFWLRQIDG